MKLVITPHISGILVDVYEDSNFDISKAKFYKFNYEDNGEMVKLILNKIEKEKYEISSAKTTV